MITVTILTKNAEKYLQQVLEALRDFTEVAILDTGSQDRTIEIAKQFDNVVVYQHDFIGFGPSHNLLSSMAKNDWILSIDGDEIVTEELKNEIVSLKLDKNSVYSFCRHNFYKGKWIKGCGWYPDRQIRLYNRTVTRFSDAQVHEAVIAHGLKQVKLKSALNHYPYACIHDFLAKMQSYSTLFAKQNRGKRTSSLGKAIGHGLFAFFRSYILKRGFLLGQEGFVISAYNGHTAFYKYLKLQEANEAHVDDQTKR
ncbi:MAG: glycosyltransferase family 2 protein [Verrucomicrobia bacterium]|nr:glycosyltransferase family 2 protein [Verrucomicrobiota bacterium]